MSAAQLTTSEAQAQCQQALSHTICLDISLSGPMIHLTLCGLDMLAGKTGELPPAFSTNLEVTISTGFKIIHFHA